MVDFGIRVPAIRGRQGNRIFYVTNLPNEFLRNLFKDVKPAAEQSQRPLDPRHSQAIREYIRQNREEYLLGALTYAMDLEGEFKPLSEDAGDHFALGELNIPLGTSFSSLDGQHRRQALIDLIEEVPSLKAESTAVLLYVEPELKKKRQMFSDMNSTPKKVSKSLNIAFDNRDPFARGAKILIRTHPLLVNRVEELAPRVNSESSNFFSLFAIQDTLKKLFVGSVGRVKDPDSYTEDLVVKRGTDFFDILMQARIEYSEALVSYAQLQEYRKTTILFSSTTLRVVAGATYRTIDFFSVQNLREIEDQLSTGLSSIDFSVDSKLFIAAGFINRGSSTPNARNQEVFGATNRIFNILKGESFEELPKGKGLKRIKIREK